MLHFLLPFLLVGLVCLHLTFLHLKGSSNPEGTERMESKSPFSPYYTSKDLYGF
jgi:quinol-cytochrome oxidoreductase complex cytochrome b subunit